MSRHGIARVLSKLGLCSRSEAARWVRAGRVRVNGVPVRDPEHPTRLGIDGISIDQVPVSAHAPIHLMLNKPRGLVTTRSDEHGRATVYRCFEGSGLPWIAPVGRLDQASEGLLLFSNDPAWAARICDPRSGPDKTYHVQVRGSVDLALCRQLCEGIEHRGERLVAVDAEPLRQNPRSAWLRIVLAEGRNRQIRRMLEALERPVLRLVRVAIGGLRLGDLPKGQWRLLDADALARLDARPARLARTVPE